MDFSAGKGPMNDDGSHKKGRSSYSPFTLKNNYIKGEGVNSSDQE